MEPWASGKSIVDIQSYKRRIFILHGGLEISAWSEKKNLCMKSYIERGRRARGGLQGESLWQLSGLHVLRKQTVRCLFLGRKQLFGCYYSSLKIRHAHNSCSCWQCYSTDLYSSWMFSKQVSRGFEWLHLSTASRDSDEIYRMPLRHDGGIVQELCL